MTINYRAFFGMSREAFPQDPALKDILETQGICRIKERLDYVLAVGAVGLVTGEVGSGKSTAMRYILSKLHPSAYQIISITACSGSILEFYRLFLAELNIEKHGVSRAAMIRLIQKEIKEIILGKKRKVLLVVDEASMLRLEVFAEIHTITQFDHDSRPWLPIMFVGRTNLADKFYYPASKPLASRVVAKAHLEPVDREGMERYLEHHLALTGIKTPIFDETAITAIHQGSGGFFRKANHLARGALVAAASEKSTTVTPEHVRLASTEIF
jgi:type II secretory pathway predicted ATPase ExeA